MDLCKLQVSAYFVAFFPKLIAIFDKRLNDFNVFKSANLFFIVNALCVFT